METATVDCEVPVGTLVCELVEPYIPSHGAEPERFEWSRARRKLEEAYHYSHTTQLVVGWHAGYGACDVEAILAVDDEDGWPEVYVAWTETPLEHLSQDSPEFGFLRGLAVGTTCPACAVASSRRQWEESQGCRACGACGWAMEAERRRIQRGIHSSIPVCRS